MKLPRLSNPTVIYRDENTTITTSSIYDHMSTRAQWIVMMIPIFGIIILLVCVYLSHKGILK